jgi:hypothetical protein
VGVPFWGGQCPPPLPLASAFTASCAPAPVVGAKRPAKARLTVPSIPFPGRVPPSLQNIWACSLCQKRQQILAKTGKWFQQPQKEQLQSGTSPGQM